MESILDGIAWLFEEVLFIPYNLLRFLEDESWWAANVMSWIFIIIGFIAFFYWMKQLRIFNENDEEDRTIVAHSFLAPVNKS